MKKTMTDKNYESFTTNDGYIVSEWFCNPLNVKKELNISSS